MPKEKLSLAEQFLQFSSEWLEDNRIPFLSALVSGLLAYTFAFTNKLPNHDDVVYLFSKGATGDSGRWGLNLLRLLIPDLSMPWLHGIVSLILLALSICLILKIFDLRSSLSRILLPALIICFPSQIGTFCYMYTCSCYAVAFLLAILAVLCAKQNGVFTNLLSVLCITLMLSIYQAYIAITAGMMVLLLIQKLLYINAQCRADRRSATVCIFRKGLVFLFLLAVGLTLYLFSVRLYHMITGTSYNGYSNELQMYAPDFPEGIGVAYRMFFYNLTSRYNMVLISKVSRLLHFFAFAVTGVGLVSTLFNSKSVTISEIFLLIFCLLLLPLCICCFYIVIYWSGIHTLVLYGYIVLYILMFVVVETLSGLTESIVTRGMKDVLAISLVLVIGSNICFANRTFLKLHLAYENAYSLSTTLVTQLRSLPNYTKDTPVAVYPSAGEALHFANAFGDDGQLDHDIMGAQFQLLTGYTEASFFEYYLGAEINIVSHEKAIKLAEDERCRKMPVYPDSGSICMIDDTVFIKFKDIPESSGEPFVYHSSPFQ